MYFKIKRHICIILVLFYFFILFFYHSKAFADLEKSVNGRPFIQNYVPYAYHGSNQVWEIIQDDRGIMYFANSETGILEYDGVSWCTIALDNRDTCRSLAKDRDGRIYAGGVGEIGYLEIINGETVYVSLKTHLPEAHRDFKDVWKTAVAESGVYFQTGHKIFRWHDGKFSIITTETGFRRATCAVNGKVYTYQKKTGVMEIVGNEMRLIPGGDVFADDQVYLMLPRENDTIMFVSEKQGLFVYDGNTVSHFPTEADVYPRERVVQGWGCAVRRDDCNRYPKRRNRCFGSERENR